MPDNWNDEREDWRARGWRERETRGDNGQRREDRSFDDAPRGRVFGEQESGVDYHSVTPPRAPPRGDERGAGRPDWQDRDYRGASPAMQHGGLDAPRFQSQDYTDGTRYGGDDGRQRFDRPDYGQGGREYGPQPRRYEADERGYGDGGRRDGGDFLQRAGQRLSTWFGSTVDEVRRDLGPQAGRESRFEPERAPEPRGHRGRGPKNYQRSDDRISDEAHQRLTDDAWIDASNVSISVSGGEVTLSGTVDSREAKHRAERCVEDLSGVQHVQNNLRVAKGNFFTSPPSSGFGDSAAQQQMREDTGADGENKTPDDSAATRTTTRRT